MTKYSGQNLDLIWILNLMTVLWIKSGIIEIISNDIYCYLIVSASFCLLYLALRIFLIKILKTPIFMQHSVLQEKK
jgi:hypothetical protein